MHHKAGRNMPFIPCLPVRWCDTLAGGDDHPDEEGNRLKASSERKGCHRFCSFRMLTTKKGVSEYLRTQTFNFVTSQIQEIQDSHALRQNIILTKGRALDAQEMTQHDDKDDMSIHQLNMCVSYWMSPRQQNLVSSQTQKSRTCQNSSPWAGAGRPQNIRKRKQKKELRGEAWKLILVGLRS